MILDLDDTLFLERDYALSGFAAVDAYVTATYGRAGFGEASVALFADGVRGDTFNRALASVGLPDTPETVRELVGVYRRHAPSISLTADAARLLPRLRGHYVGVVTDGPLESQHQKALAVGAPRWSSAVIYTATLGPGFGKPHPRAFAMHQAAAGRSGTACVYVADNPSKDFAGPKALGWQTVRIRRPDSLHAGVPSGPLADLEIASLDELELTR